MHLSGVCIAESLINMPVHFHKLSFLFDDSVIVYIFIFCRSSAASWLLIDVPAVSAQSAILSFLHTTN